MSQQHLCCVISSFFQTSFTFLCPTSWSGLLTTSPPSLHFSLKIIFKKYTLGLDYYYLFFYPEAQKNPYLYTHVVKAWSWLMPFSRSRNNPQCVMPSHMVMQPGLKKSQKCPVNVTTGSLLAPDVSNRRAQVTYYYCFYLWGNVWKEITECRHRFLFLPDRRGFCLFAFFSFFPPPSSCDWAKSSAQGDQEAGSWQENAPLHPTWPAA